MIYLKLFYEFFKVGLFSVGGGLATLPFLYDMAASTGWFTIADISDMVAVSESTPGPLGINMSTYTGFKSAGLLGSIIAPIGLITPSIIIIIILAGFLNKFKESKIVQDTFYGLRAASVGLIAAAGIQVVKISLLKLDIISNDSYSIIDLFFWKGIILAVLVYFLIKYVKLHPIFFIALSAVIGIVFKF